ELELQDCMAYQGRPRSTSWKPRFEPRFSPPDIAAECWYRWRCGACFFIHPADYTPVWPRGVWPVGQLYGVDPVIAAFGEPDLSCCRGVGRIGEGCAGADKT